ncbi:hypothetical protein C9374_005504 [Naegleria lovaniensis]|uniref:Uncharacterized protein n=1 Tax=Naegleria lovaniensis TaxID=51637 RepID=A0AA88GPV7_NAELO|nr:uncharacterized protein C9374_005504 [Naegleria lovaniensis]KAG2382302.1 hypothetical protein C9374_005504 [Naegleria lovaniensis]
MDDKFIGTALTHLTKLALDNSEPLPLTLRNITFQIMKELTISYPSNTNIMVNIENVTIPNLEKLSMQCACINTAGKNQFPNLQSLNFHHCKFDSSFWIDSHRTISTIALSEIELGSLSSSIRQVVIDSHPSIEIVFVSCFDDISILNCPSLKKAYIERCKKPEKLQDIISSFKKIHNLKCTVSEEHSYIIEQLKDQPSTKYDNVSKLSSLATKIVTHSQEFDVGSTLKNCQRLQSLTSSSQLNFNNRSYSSHSQMHYIFKAFHKEKVFMRASKVITTILLDPISLNSCSHL